MIKVGIIGCGQMGRWHFEAYRNHPEVVMAAFCDTNEDRANDLAKRIGAKVYTDYNEMFRQEKLQGVSICTIPSTHRDITTAALNADVHVLCEKPLAISVSEAEAMMKLAKEKQKILLSAFKFRFFEEVQQAKEILEKKMLGKIYNFRLMFGGYINMAGTWYVQKEISGGGIIIDNGPHAFDLVRHLLGEIKTVKASVHKFQDIPVEDTAEIFCELEDGATGNVDVSWSIPVPAQSYFEIYGEEGAILLDFKGLSYKLKTWDDWKRVVNKSDGKAAFERQTNHFVDSLAGRIPLVTTPEDGLKVQYLIDSAYKSLSK